MLIWLLFCLKVTESSFIDCSSISNINRLIVINWYRLASILIDWQFHQLRTPGLSLAHTLWPSTFLFQMLSMVLSRTFYDVCDRNLRDILSILTFMFMIFTIVQLSTGKHEIRRPTFPFNTIFWLPHSTDWRLTLFPDAYTKNNMQVKN